MLFSNTLWIYFNYQETHSFNFIIFNLLVISLSIILLSIAILLSTLRKSSISQRTEGFETYEFGTTSIGNSSLNTINKHFYILGLLFIIFDIELMFIFPWIYSNDVNKYNSKDLLIIFTILIIMGFLYEIINGALNWYNPPSIILKNRFGVDDLIIELCVKLSYLIMALVTLIIFIKLGMKLVVGKLIVKKFYKTTPPWMINLENELAYIFPCTAKYLKEHEVEIKNFLNIFNPKKIIIKFKIWIISYLRLFFKNIKFIIIIKSLIRNLNNILKKRKIIFLIYLNINVFLFLKTLLILTNWDFFLFNSKFQFTTKNINQSLISITINYEFLNLWFGLDFFNLILILVTIILVILAVLSNWNSNLMHSSYLFLFLILWIEIMAIIAFLSIDLFIFFLSFEGITIPTFFLIYLYGSEITKIRASFMFLLCSLTSSTFITLSLISLYSLYKTSNINILILTFDSTYYLNNFNFLPNISIERYLFLWITLFLGFAFKIPLCPFHMWLPEAHAEAPTAGSVLLAGFILKLGGYGLFRFFLPLFYSFTFFNPLIYTLSLLGILYSSLSCIRTSHIKQIIAYSSINHMGVSVIGLMSNYNNSIIGSLYGLIQHSFISSGLFIIAGILYERYEVYEINHLQGLNQVMPLFSFYLILFLFINLPFPIFGTFIGEFCLLSGLWKNNLLILFILILNEFLSALYSIWFIHRLIFTGLNINFSTKVVIIKYQDLIYKEFIIIFICLFILILTGINSNLYLHYFNF